ncbi:2-keto-4-pentenoate hydratase [Corynebacterium ammoniagenes]|uniref:2-keto-4-pentenoate hydratase n=2 Tax=Corynebacterium ammoniagenes TaxID=1697 RepID=A0AAV5G5T7_CORAM|nr:fumarylacetoacetate hydrolase family protein [Corynebacterium ammoniagenes]APT81857.1 2-oxopent-4-enoate hydratase [Corynebacterium ammoniagenes DSM 20306]AQS72972.1 2-oxopent-4-enoate hydratase [Corynebacterium ammoniagenes]EFG80982.1 Hydratase/decarboxylase [Corynebacterium ammoniagenes DSM 20306]GJN41675.1 2-keto-4-pentenoate hydratase [Corynebacterium ammoniagenes]
MSQIAQLHDEVASQLFDAYTSHKTVVPPRETIDKLDIAGAYRIQRWQQRAFEDQGHTVIGHKIGLTSLAMQQQLGVASPDFGFFTDRMRFDAGQPIPTASFIAPKVEPELAFTLNADLPADASLAQVQEAIDTVHLAVEIIDSRIANWDIRLVDTVADNASCGAIVLGDAIDVELGELAGVEATMTLNNEAAGSGKGSDVMGDPLIPLQWLAQTLGEQGTLIKAGSIVLTGSFCGAVAFAPGDKLDVDYGTHGSLSLTFS